MPIRNFEVGGRKSLVRAAYQNLPDLVFVTGGNGAGKSSFLMLLKQAGVPEPGTKVMHVGPHRPWRKQQLQKAAVHGLPMSYNELLENQNFPQLDQFYFRDLFRISGHARDPDATDESQSLVKAAIASLNEKYRDRLQEVHEGSGRIDPGQFGEPFAPVKDLLERLLPHLAFVRIDENQKNDVKVMFSSRYSFRDSEYDIDLLSSGEKAILSLFWPVLEYQIHKNLGIIHPTEARTFIIDEPELHLHPGLQADVVAYLRHLTESENIQFIVATHSPTIIEAALPDELYLISPWQSSPDGNQFSKLADSHDRLLAVKELLGSAFSYSRTRPVLFIEGEFASDTTKHTDIGILELILPNFRGYVYVPSRGKTQAIAGAERLRRAALEQGHSITAFALVDADYDDSGPDWVVPWPVCMVENLLLDPASLAATLAPYSGHGSLRGVAEVERALDGILQSLVVKETERRLAAILKPIHYRPEIVWQDGVPKASLAEDVGAQIASYNKTLEGRWRDISDAVKREISEGAARLKFHGKTVLQLFFEQHVQRYIPKYQNFVFQLAREVGISRAAEKYVASSIHKVNNYFPRDIVDLLNSEAIEKHAVASGVSIARIRRWAAERLELCKAAGTTLTVPNAECERDLLLILNHVRATGLPDTYRRLSPLVVDVISR